MNNVSLHKPGIRKFKRRKVYARFNTIFEQEIYLKWNNCLQIIKMLKNNFSMVMLIVHDVVDCQTNKNVKYLLRVKDVFTKCAWVRYLNDKKVKQL